MSITVELPPDIEELVRTIPDLDQRVLTFLRAQVEYEMAQAALQREGAAHRRSGPARNGADEGGGSFARGDVPAVVRGLRRDRTAKLMPAIRAVLDTNGVAAEHRSSGPGSPNREILTRSGVAGDPPSSVKLLSTIAVVRTKDCTRSRCLIKIAACWNRYAPIARLCIRRFPEPQQGRQAAGAAAGGAAEGGGGAGGVGLVGHPGGGDDRVESGGGDGKGPGAGAELINGGGGLGVGGPW